jgi:outer membrane lipopolysaccharide assembly protein LptE/RlpB
LFFPGNRWPLLAAWILAALVAAVTVAGCGYHVVGTESKFPADWQTVEIPAFTNKTARYRIEQRLTEAVIREFLSRTKYRVVSTGPADAVLHGEVLSIETVPLLFDATTGQVTAMLVTVHAKATLTDAHTEKVVYENKDMVFREEYQISSDIPSFFEESAPALQRMAHDFAARLVADLLEGF